MIEALIALALLGVLFVKLALIAKESSRVRERESTAMALDDQAQVVLDRIAYAVIGSDPETIFPGAAAPFFSDSIQYRVSLGVENGQVVWEDPEVIGVEDGTSNLYWGRNEGTPEERIVVWCRTVADYFENELPNGEDDNGNTLADETGLSFVLDGKSVTIRLTLQRMTADGPVQETRETVVTCRN